MGATPTIGEESPLPTPTLAHIRIRSCFGFVDSGLVELRVPGNLVYILGKNSSGKTALLTAIRYLVSDDIPQSHPNFINFDPGSEIPEIVGYFQGHLSRPQFITDFREVLAVRGIPREIVNTDNRIKGLVDAAAEAHFALFDSQEFSVARLANGEYRFRDAEDDAAAATARHDELGSRLGSVFPGDLFQVGANNIGLSIRVHDVAAVLARQLPKIILFTAAYSLGDSLPERLDEAMLDTPPNALTRAWIDVVGSATLREFVSARSPVRKRQLEELLQRKMRKILGDPPAGGLLDFDLYGLQLTVMTDGKNAFYHHASDATKILIAYHIYAAAAGFKRGVLLFDEPNTGFHASIQRDVLLPFLGTLAERGNLVVVSTHSEHLIDIARLPGVRIMSGGSDNTLHVKTRPYHRPLHGGDQMALQPVYDAIGLRVGDRIGIKDELLLVEGVTELLYLKAFMRVLAFERQVNICPARGDATIRNIVPLLIAQGLSFKVLVDQGDTRKKLQDEFGMRDGCIREVRVPDEFRDRFSTAGIEDLLSRYDYKNVLASCGIEVDEDAFANVPNSYYAKRTPKRIVAEKVLEAAESSSYAFDDQTKAAFRAVLEFGSVPPWFVL